MTMLNLLSRKSTREPEFEHPLVVKQSNGRSRWIIWILMGSTTALVAWANFSKIEEAILVQGKLEPQGSAKEVQVPVNGVVKELYVKDGQTVKAGDRLLSLDPTTIQAQLLSSKKIRDALLQENAYYQSVLGGQSDVATSIAIPSQMQNLTKTRSSLLAENRLAEAQLSGSSAGANLSLEQQARLNAEQRESNTRERAAQLEVQQIQNQVEILKVKQDAAEEGLAVESRIYNDIKPLADAGGIGRIQLLKQQQARDTRQAEVDGYVKERNRLQSMIEQAGVRVENTTAVDTKEFTGRIGLNTQRLAEIDGQLSKAIVENEKKIAEIDSQLSQTQQMLKYSEVKAPVSGVVFNMKASGPGYVANPAMPLLTIVPIDNLIAKVSITNKDIGFVKEGMIVDVRLDSFPFSEFGDVKGTITSIGSDALPPTETQPFYVFPAKIQLKSQDLMVGDRAIKLQSGMSLSANIKVRDRTVISIFTDMFSKTSESLKFVR